MSNQPDTTITIRRATPDDATAVIDLINALAKFEHLNGPAGDAHARFLEYGFGPSPKFECWLAEKPDEGSKAVGYVVIYNTFSTFLLKPGLYLEDVFVLPEYRRLGIGTLLLTHAIELAVERGCGRLEWACLDWNLNAQAVYDGIGARRMHDWLLYRMTQDTMAGYLHVGSSEKPE